jgi:hypothetical protein
MRNPQSKLTFVFGAFQNTLDFESQLVPASCPGTWIYGETSVTASKGNQWSRQMSLQHSLSTTYVHITLVFRVRNAGFVHQVGADVMLPQKRDNF